MWVLTYGDMMSLLLVFFIMLVAMSELKQERFRAIVASFQAVFGTQAGGTRIPVTDDPDTSVIKILEKTQVKQLKDPNLSNTQDPGMDGRQPTVTRVREDLQFVVGGFVTFEPGSAELTAKAQEQLTKVSRQFAGFRNKIELRGHAATAEWVRNSEFSDLLDLGYARAKAVQGYLVKKCGIDPDRIRVVSCGDREPLAKREYDLPALEPNRRVEILISEALVQDFNKPEAGH